MYNKSIIAIQLHRSTIDNGIKQIDAYAHGIVIWTDDIKDRRYLPDRVDAYIADVLGHHNTDSHLDNAIRDWATRVQGVVKDKPLYNFPLTEHVNIITESVKRDYVDALIRDDVHGK